MHTFLPDERVEMENDEYDDNGLPSCDQNGEDDNGVDPNFKDGRNAIELRRCALEKLEDTGGTIEDFREQNDIGKQNESQFASTSIGDGVSPAVDEQSKVICEADDPNCGADQSENCSTGRSNGGNQDDMNEKQVTIEQSIDPDRSDVPGALSAFQDLALPENVGGGLLQPPSDEATIEGCIRGSDQTLDDELSQIQKTSPDIKGSLADVQEIEVKTDEIQIYEDKTVDSFHTGTTGILPAAATRAEDASSREMFPVLPDSVEEFDPGSSKDVRKGPIDLGHQDGKTREILGQREEASSVVADCGSPKKNGNHSGNKSAKVSIFSAKMNFMMTAIFCLSFSVTRGVAALTVLPGDVLASSGSTARIRCSTDYKSPVYWDRKLFGSDEQETVYYGKNGMARIAGGRIRVEEDSSSGRFDLVISNVQMEDAGTYTCIDEAGIGEGYPAELVVFERFTCEMPVPPNGFMGENIFEIPEDAVESTCSLSFRGSLVPSFQWTWGKVARLLTPTSINGSTVTSSVMLRATHDTNGVRLTCLPVVSADADSLDESSSWISDVVLVRYVHVTFGSVDECQSYNAMIPVCNPNCTYKVQETPDNRCQCLAVYNDQSRTYNKIFSEYSCEIPVPPSKAITVVAATVAVLAVLATATSAIILIRKFKFQRIKQKIKWNGKTEAEAEARSLTNKTEVENVHIGIAIEANCKALHQDRPESIECGSILTS